MTGTAIECRYANVVLRQNPEELDQLILRADGVAVDAGRSASLRCLDMTNARRSVDPDPFGVAVSVAGIVGGFASVISLYRELSGKQLRRSHTKAIRALGSVKDTINQIERDIASIRDLSTRAIDMAPIHFGPGQRLLMPPVQFRDYSRAAERTLGALRRVLKATHQLERAVPTLPWVQPSAARDIVSVHVLVERLLRERDRSLAEGLAEVVEIVAQVRRMADGVLVELQGHA